jgi:CheY-like chemotaxis protein
MEVAELTPIDGHPGSAAVVLLLEDNDDDVRLLEEAFRERRIPVRFVVASTAQQMYGMLRLLPSDSSPRLIILDLALPGASGHDLLRGLVADPQWRRVPKVVLSGSERDSDRTASFAAGAVEHLVKAADFDGFLRIVDLLQAYLAAGATERA